MLLGTSQPLPSTPELAEVLKRELPSHYFYELLLERESILVSKSASVKAYISTHKNKILIQAFIASSLFASMIGFLCMTELGLLLIPLFYHKGTQSLAQRDEFEKELSLFLEYKYKASQFKD